MITIKCCIDRINKFSIKPSKEWVPKIQKSVLEGQNVYSIKQLAHYVVNGHSFCPSVFKEVNGNIRRTKENWAGTQLIGLDFDDGISLEEFKERNKEYGLMPIIDNKQDSQAKDVARLFYGGKSLEVFGEMTATPIINIIEQEMNSPFQSSISTITKSKIIFDFAVGKDDYKLFAFSVY